MVLQPSFSYFHLWSLHQSGRDGSYDEFIGRIGIWPNTCHASCHTIDAARESAVVVKEPKLKVDLTRYVEDTGDVWSFDEAEIWLEKSESTLTFSLCGRKLIEVAWPTCMTPCWGWMIFSRFCAKIRQEHNFLFDQAFDENATRWSIFNPWASIGDQWHSIHCLKGEFLEAWSCFEMIVTSLFKYQKMHLGVQHFFRFIFSFRGFRWFTSPFEATNESLYKSCVQPVIDAVLDLEILNRTQNVAWLRVKITQALWLCLILIHWWFPTSHRKMALFWSKSRGRQKNRNTVYRWISTTTETKKDRSIDNRPLNTTRTELSCHEAKRAQIQGVPESEVHLLRVPLYFMDSSRFLVVGWWMQPDGFALFQHEDGGICKKSIICSEKDQPLVSSWTDGCMIVMSCHINWAIEAILNNLQKSPQHTPSAPGTDRRAVAKPLLWWARPSAWCGIYSGASG